MMARKFVVSGTHIADGWPTYYRASAVAETPREAADIVCARISSRWPNAFPTVDAIGVDGDVSPGVYGEDQQNWIPKENW